MIDALLFDMDGLIFDTESVYKKSWQYAAQQMGYELTDDYYQGFIGVQDLDCERMLCEHFGEGFDLKRTKLFVTNTSVKREKKVSTISAVSMNSSKPQRNTI